LKIVFDTNFLLIPYQFGVDIFSELDRIIPEKNELVVYEGVVSELKKIAEKHTKDAPAARFALNLIKEKDINIESAKDINVDDWIVAKARKERIVVCTNDMKLRRKLRKIALVVGLREKSHLQIVAGDYFV